MVSKNYIKSDNLPLKDHTGERFNKLVVLRFAGWKNSKVPSGHKCKISYWTCKCDCGNIRDLGLQCIKRVKNCKQCRIGLKLPAGEAAFNDLFKRTRKVAKQHNKAFTLTKTYFKFITSQNCFYCNIPPHRNYNGCQYSTYYLCNGVDRINSDKGYIKGNCVPCCKTCNFAKNNLPLPDFIKWIKRLTTYSQSINFEYNKKI